MAIPYIVLPPIPLQFLSSTHAMLSFWQMFSNSWWKSIKNISRICEIEDWEWEVIHIALSPFYTGDFSASFFGGCEQNYLLRTSVWYQSSLLTITANALFRIHQKLKIADVEICKLQKFMHVLLLPKIFFLHFRNVAFQLCHAQAQRQVEIQSPVLLTLVQASPLQDLLYNTRKRMICGTYSRDSSHHKATRTMGHSSHRFTTNNRHNVSTLRIL